MLEVASSLLCEIGFKIKILNIFVLTCHRSVTGQMETVVSTVCPIQAWCPPHTHTHGQSLLRKITLILFK